MLEQYEQSHCEHNYNLRKNHLSQFGLQWPQSAISSPVHCSLCTQILISVVYFISSSQGSFKEAEALFGSVEKGLKHLAIARKPGCCKTNAGLLLKRQRSQLKKERVPLWSGRDNWHVTKCNCSSTVVVLQVSYMKSHESLMIKKEKLILRIGKDKKVNV